MKHFSAPLSLVSLFLLLSGLPSQVSGSDVKESWKDRPVVVALSDDDLADARRVRELARILERASEEESNAVVFQLNLTAELDLDTLQRVLDIMSGTKLPSFVWVDPIATGPGALLALAGESIYLSPQAIVGGAGLDDPESDDEDSKTSSSRQKKSVLKARARSLATQYGHPIEVIEAMIDGTKEFKVGDKVLAGSGEVLTLTAKEATQDWKGKPLLAKGLAESVEDLLRAEKVSGEPVTVTPRGFGEATNRERLTSVRDDAKEGEEGKETAEDESETLFGRRDEGSYRDKVVVLKVGQDTLATGKASFEFMERTIKKAELDGAAALVFDMDTPGGFAWYTEGLVLNSLQNVTYPTFTFVNSRAESAGAIIALGTDHIYMKPAATIGSALVVSGTGQDLAEDMSDKVTQMIIGTVRNVAEIKGHNPDVAEAFVTRDKEVKVDGIVIHEAGNVLNLNTIRATEVIDGKPVLAKGVASNVADLLKQEGIESDILKAEPLGMEAFAHWVQKLSVLLIVVGLAGAYLELNSPGFGLPGLTSVLAFGVFFFGNYMAGNLAGYELAVLLVLGLILLGVEVFVFPGAVLPGAIGGTLVVVALGLAMVDRVDLEWKWEGLPGSDSWISIFRGSFMALALGMAGAVGAILLGMRFLPETKLGSRFILTEAVSGGAALAEGSGSDEAEKATLEGVEGEATTDLMPSGKGRFEGRLYDIVSDGEFISKGSRVKIAKHEGSRVVVRKIS